MTSSGGLEPFVVTTYGPSGIGKTTDMGYSFPTALFVAAPGALSSVRSVCGYLPARAEDINDIPSATKLIEREGASGKYQTVVIDDFSFLAEQTFAMLEKRYTGFKLWGALRDVVLEFRNQSRFAGMNVVLNCWEQGPKTRANGQKVRGGPQLSGNLPEQLPAMCDVVLRAVHAPARQPWPSAYECTVNPAFNMKDRFNVATRCSPAPMNLAELLRAAGHEIQRHPEIPQQEEHVALIAAELSGNTAEDAEKANAYFKELRSSGLGANAVRWTIRDAMDRAVIRRCLDQHDSMFLSPQATIPLLGIPGITRP